MSLTEQEEKRIKTENEFKYGTENIKDNLTTEVETIHNVGDDEITIKLEPLLKVELNSDNIDVEKDRKQIFSCAFCSEQFGYIELYELHSVIHDKTHATKDCPCCKKRYRDVERYTLHIQDHINKHKLCDFCNKIFFNQLKLNRHTAEHKKNGDLMCNFCGKTFQIRKSYVVHLRVHTNERPYECDLCTSKFKQLSCLKSHKDLVHAQGTPHECEVCHGKFCTKSSLKRHMKRHVAGRTIVCKPCNLEFLNKELYDKHKKDHHLKVSQFFEICPDCNEEFFTYREYVYHRKTHKPNKNIKERSLEHNILQYDNFGVKKLPQNKPYEICWLCGEKVLCTMITDHRNKHMLMTREEVLECTRKKRFPCKLCNNVYTQKKRLFGHMDTHMDKTLECTKGCGSEYLFSYYGLTRHDRRLHMYPENDPSIRKCKLCGEDVLKNIYSNHLNGHIQMTSNEIMECKLSNTWPCKQCGVKFSRKKVLLTHVDTHMDKVYECPKGCIRMFTYWGLQHHKCRYFGSRDHKKLRKCFLCGSDVLVKEYNPHLNDHLQLTKEEILECKASKQYPCKFCNVVGPSLSFLMKHVVTHTPRIFQCDKHLNCKNNLYTYVGLKAHQRSTHDEFFCKKCNKTFTGYQRFTSHHHKNDYASNKFCQKVFKCLWCSANFNSPMALTHHYNTHKTVDFRCRICNKRCVKAHNMKIHMKKVHKQRFTVEDCYKYLFDKDDVIDSKEDETVTCNWCKVSVNSKLALVKHMKIHTCKRHECKKCKMSFTDFRQYLNHLKSDVCTRWMVEALVTEAKDLTCPFCDESFTQYFDVSQHIATLHLKEDYSCKLCNLNQTVETLRTHFWKKHPRRKKYVCVGCSAAFVTFKVYIQHRKGCTDCPLLFKKPMGSQGSVIDTNLEGTNVPKMQAIGYNLDNTGITHENQLKHQEFTCGNHIVFSGDNSHEDDIFDIPDKVVVNADGDIIIPDNGDSSVSNLMDVESLGSAE